MTHAGTDLLIAGAGPAGSALAAAAARNGLRVILTEAATHPRPKACAEYASPRIVEELERLGVSETWRGAAVALDGMRVVVGGAAVELHYRDDRGPRTAWGLDRPRFDAVLAEHAALTGAELREATRLVELTWRNGRVTGARLRRDGRVETIHADWVVGADGARSATAHLLGAERMVRYPRRLGLVAHYAGIPELTSTGEMHVGDDFYIGLAPMPGGELNVGMALPLDGAVTAPTRFEQALRALPAVAARLARSPRLTPIRGASPIGHRVARAAGPGWLLIGDAAGFIDPFTGEGIYRALRSARAAATALLGERGSVVERYLAERRAAFATKDLLTWLVQGMLASPPLLRYAVRRLASRPRAAGLLGSALGDCRPASDALSPRFVVEVLRP